MTKETYWQLTRLDNVNEPPKEYMRFFLTEDGDVDVKIADGVELTEAAKFVVETIRNAGRNANE